LSPAPSDVSSTAAGLSSDTGSPEFEPPQCGSDAATIFQNAASFARQLQAKFPGWSKVDILVAVRDRAEQGGFGDLYAFLHPTDERNEEFDNAHLDVGYLNSHSHISASYHPSYVPQPTYSEPPGPLPHMFPGTINPQSLERPDPYSSYVTYTEALTRDDSASGNIDADSAQPDMDFGTAPFTHSYRLNPLASQDIPDACRFIPHPMVLPVESLGNIRVL